MKKTTSRILSFVTALAITVSILSTNISLTSKAATWNDINQSGVFLKQELSDSCTACAATMLIRRVAMMRGDSDWYTISEAEVRDACGWNTVRGIRLLHTYDLPSDYDAKANALRDMLSRCPEGLVVYDEDWTSSYSAHAILLTDFTDGQFYCCDPAGSVPGGRIPLSSSLVSLQSIDAVWFCSSPLVSLTSSTNPVTMTSPEFTFDKNVYYVGDTVNVTWKESSPESNLDHYWISVYSPGGTTDVQERIDPPASSTSFTPTQEGEHTVTIWATPKGSEAGEGSLTVQQTIYVRSLKSELTVLPGSSTEATKFNWSATRDNKEYNLRIFNGELWNSEEVGSAWLLTDTSYECVLPAGHYNAYVDTVFSDDSFEMSNIIEFDVAVSIPAAPKLSIAKDAYDSESAVSVKWDKVNEASSYWLHIYKDGKDYTNKTLNQDLEYTAQYPPGTYVMYIISRNEAGEGVANVSFTVYAKGDCNGDGEFNISDVVLLQKWLLAVPDTHFENWKAANFCDDDRLDVFDLCLMKRKLIYG